MKSLLIVLITVTMFAMSCSSDTEFGADSRVAGNAVSISNALKPSSWNREIKVMGVVSKICSDEGCWIVIKDSTASIRVSFAEDGFAAPMDCEGKNVIAEGVVVDVLVKGSVAKSFAKDKGENDSIINTINSDTRIQLMKAYRLEIISK